MSFNLSCIIGWMGFAYFCLHFLVIPAQLCIRVCIATNKNISVSQLLTCILCWYSYLSSYSVSLLCREVPADTTQSAEGSQVSAALVHHFLFALESQRGTVLVGNVYRDQMFCVG